MNRRESFKAAAALFLGVAGSGMGAAPMKTFWDELAPLSPTIIKTMFLIDVAHGRTVSQCARRAGVPLNIFYAMLQEDKEFAKAFEYAKASGWRGIIRQVSFPGGPGKPWTKAMWPVGKPENATFE